MCEATDKRKDPPLSSREDVLVRNGVIGQRALCGAGGQETKEMDTLQGGIGRPAVQASFFFCVFFFCFFCFLVVLVSSSGPLSCRYRSAQSDYNLEDSVTSVRQS